MNSYLYIDSLHMESLTESHVSRRVTTYSEGNIPIVEDNPLPAEICRAVYQRVGDIVAVASLVDEPFCRDQQVMDSQGRKHRIICLDAVSNVIPARPIVTVSDTGAVWRWQDNGTMGYDPNLFLLHNQKRELHNEFIPYAK